MRAIFDDPTHLVIAYMNVLPRARLFAVQLEHWHFPPLTPLNKVFHYGLLTWLDMPWTVAAVPMGARPTVEKVAADNNLRLANGFPLCFDGSGAPQKFPFCGDNVYTLETRDSGGLGVEVIGQPGETLEEDLLIETVIAEWQEKATDAKNGN